MQNILRILRYVILALVIICNAIISSVAVWNQSVSPQSVSVFSVDICVTCLAALQLMFSFAKLFLELAGKDSVTGKVWFECAWVAALFVVNLVVASAASAILVTQSCVPGFIDACTSTQTLLSFSWIITVVLLVYTLTLFTSIYLVRREHPDIWHAHVRHFPRLRPKRRLSSGPPTPDLPTFTNVARPPSLVAPVPRPFRTFPALDNSYQHSSGLDPEYVTEHFERQIRSFPYPIQRLPPVTDDNHQPLPSLYPQFIQGALKSTPEGFSVPERQRSQAERIPSPPPLANWPRYDVLSQPVKPKRAKDTRVPNVTPDPVVNVSQHPLGPRRMPPPHEE